MCRWCIINFLISLNVRTFNSLYFIKSINIVQRKLALFFIKCIDIIIFILSVWMEDNFKKIIIIYVSYLTN